MGRAEMELVERIIDLTPTSRQAVLDKVAARLAGPPEADEPVRDGPMHPGWDQEIVSRLDEIDSGTVKMVPWDEVYAKLMARHRPSN